MSLNEPLNLNQLHHKHIYKLILQLAPDGFIRKIIDEALNAH